jgi:hypothetical protein
MEVAIALRLQRRRDVDLREDAEPFARESLDGSRTCLAEGDARQWLDGGANVTEPPRVQVESKSHR